MYKHAEVSIHPALAEDDVGSDDLDGDLRRLDRRWCCNSEQRFRLREGSRRALYFGLHDRE
jgi:hypothetical protein